MTAQADLPQISFTVAQACRVSGIGKTKLYALIAEGRLQKVKIDSKTLIPARSLHTLIEGEAHSPSANATTG